ncbi:hypothetical protein AN477_06210 [Alicyclobacillus ferrooxydans]|uniref:Uncharacterized protein n=1 Tax=Alicyclobacillus ferrooxydans TaxID=471514 RepID=A0A0P9CGA6_9BACL|nr:hypothetical protein AN477_06210 [Alicyclobacillus ferrooxydans]
MWIRVDPEGIRWMIQQSTRQLRSTLLTTLHPAFQNLHESVMSGKLSTNHPVNSLLDVSKKTSRTAGK